jgi:glycosyltransferase involved in cell wall biosynthesis
VAAVIATHNGAGRGYVFNAIGSVLAQSLRPDEIVVVDDASTDRTAEVLKERYGDAVRIVSLPKNRGPSGARNEGVRATVAPLIAFLDDDDEWLPEKLEVQRRFIEETSCHLVFSRVELIDSGGRTLHGRRPIYQEACSWPGILFRNPVQGPSSVLACRQTILAAGGFPEEFRIGEDWILWARVAEIGKIGFTERPLVRYRVHGQQAAAGRDATWTRERTLEALKDLADRLPRAQRALLLNSYAYGGAWRALASRNLGAARRLATAAAGRVDWPFLLRRGIQGGLAQLVPPLSECMDRRELTRLVRLFESLDSTSSCVQR